MKRPLLDRLAEMIVDYSLKVKSNDRVLITYNDCKTNGLVKKIIKHIYKVGGIPFVRMYDPEVSALLKELTDEKRIPGIINEKQFEIDNFDCFIRIRYVTNDYEDRLVSNDMLKKIGERTRELEDIRINHKRWVILNYPSPLDAYKAKMKIDEFYHYAMDAMVVDYQSMSNDIKALKLLMEKTDRVRIVGPGTDIVFSIKGMPIVPCAGEQNIPDGEIFVAPIKDSVNGKISYNTEAPYQGHVYKNVVLSFKDGKIINATSDDGKDEILNSIFDTDEGSRYIGEFSLGLNPKILYAMGDILYDEKILGSIHFTPGRSYKDSYNGNDSSVHWDIVLIQRSEYGGGEIYFDDVLIRKDGFFVLDELKHLNYGLKKNS